MAVKNFEPLKHKLNVVLTIISAIFLSTATGINWWTLGYEISPPTTLQYFTIWDRIDCESGVCLVSTVNSAGWINFVRIMLIVGLAAITASLVSQIIYILKPKNGFRIASLVFSGVTGGTLGLTGFVITGFFHSISKNYNSASVRATLDSNALRYQTLPLGFIFLSAFIITIVAVFILTNTAPKKRKRRSEYQMAPLGDIKLTTKGGIEM